LLSNSEFGSLRFDICRDVELGASTSTAAPLSRPENAEEDEDLIGAVGGLGISSPPTTKEPLLEFR